MGKRPRIKKPVEPTIIDKDSYTENCCSAKAKHKQTYTQQEDLEIWIDKHYSDRNQFGDDNGDRDGIEYDYVEPLVIKSLRHLKYYSLKHKKFAFLNHPPKKYSKTRVVLRQIFPDGNPLNIIVEYHFLDLNKYEVTVVTAIRKEDFYFTDGQYCIEFNESESILSVMQQRKINEVDRFEEK